MQNMKKFILFTSLLLLTGCFESEAEKVEKLTKLYSTDHKEFQKQSKRCRNLGEIQKDVDLECRAVKRATAEMLRENYTDMGKPAVILKKLP